MKLISKVRRQMASDERKPPRADEVPPAKPPAGKEKAAAGGPAAKAAARGPRAPEENPFAGIQQLREANSMERTEVFRRKLQACSVVYDFNASSVNVKEKEAKRNTLLEMVDHVSNTRNCFPETVMQDMVAMVSANIFRTLPPSQGASGGGDEEEEPALEPAWPHLQIVYELFLRFIVSTDVDAKVAKRFVDHAFVLRLLELFDAEDPRERDYLKTILHRMYGKFMALRSFMRKAIQNLFFKVIYEIEHYYGVAELLEILGSIINGFALPLKDEHRHFMIKSLIPLHKVKTLNSFHQQLSYCMTQYMEKDSRLAETIISGLLRFWPLTSTPKEVLFLNEIEEVLELTQMPEFTKVQVPLFTRIGRCIQSAHFQVAERVLFFWNNEYVLKLITHNRHQVFPLIVGPLYRNSKFHWNSTVHGLTYNVLKLLMEADTALFDEASDKERQEAENENSQAAKREARWASLQARFEERFPNGPPAEAAA